MHLYITGTTYTDIHENLIYILGIFLVLTIHLVDSNIIWTDLRSIKYM